MIIHVLIFLFFFSFTIYLRFNIGNPIFSSRLQTKYKFRSIPSILNIVLFLSKSKKPVSIHVIVFQILNYLLFIFFLIISFEKSGIDILYIKTECITGFIIVILPLFIEEVSNIIIGENWVSVDHKVEMSFDDYKICLKDSNDLASTLKFATYFYCIIIIYDDNKLPIAEGTVNYIKRKVDIHKIYEESKLKLNNSKTISFAKLNSI